MSTPSSAAPTASKIVTYTYDNHDSQNRRYDTVTINDTASPNDNGATTTYYDTEGDIVEIDSPQGTITYTYNDSTGQKTGETTNNTDIQYAYDQEGRLASVTVDKLDGGSVTPLVTTYSYDLNNNLLTTNFANGTVETRTYDTLNRLLTVKTTDGSSTIVGYTYTLDADGRRVQVVEASGRTVNYTYDNDGRLTQEKITNDPSGDNWTYTYTYDLAGNRLSLNDNGPNNDSLSYTYDADGRLTDVSGTTGTNGDSTDTSYTYDANGSMLTSTTTINGTQTTQTTYTWDLEGHMISVVTTGTGAVSASYTYDDSGNRTSQTVNGTATTYLNDPNQAYDQVLEQYAPGGILLGTYVRGLDLLFQDRTTAGGGTGLSFYAVDGLGSTRALTNSSGTVTDTYAYDAYGDLTGSTGTTTNEFLYAGYQTDAATGLDDLRARYYDAAAGQFISRDSSDGSSSDPITRNHYLYAGANPVEYIDLSGHSLLGTLGAIGIGAMIGGIDGALAGHSGQRLAVDILIGGALGSAGVWVHSLGKVYLAASYLERGLIIAGLSLSAYGTYDAAANQNNPWLAGFRGTITLAGGIFVSARTIQVFLDWLPPVITTGSGRTIQGLYGAIDAAEIETLLNSSGGKVPVFTRLSQSPSVGVGKGLSVSTYDAALADALPNPAGTKLYQANIPKALIDALELVGLAQRSKTSMGNVTGEELFFNNQILEYLVGLFSEVPGSTR